MNEANSWFRWKNQESKFNITSTSMQISMHLSCIVSFLIFCKFNVCRFLSNTFEIRMIGKGNIKYLIVSNL